MGLLSFWLGSSTWLTESGTQRGVFESSSAEASLVWPGWSPRDATAPLARLECVCAGVWVCVPVSHLRAWISVFLSLCASVCVCVCSESVVYSVICVCVCVLLPSAPSNRLIFHISHGQEGQEAARLRPEPGYSTVSNARHSLAPPKLSALLPNARAS